MAPVGTFMEASRTAGEWIVSGTCDAKIGRTLLAFLILFCLCVPYGMFVLPLVRSSVISVLVSLISLFVIGMGVYLLVLSLVCGISCRNLIRSG